MDHISIETFKGSRIWIADYSGLEFDELIERLSKAKDRIINSGESDILLIDLAERIKMNRATGEALSDFAREVKPFLRDYCAVGVSGFARTFASMLRIMGIIDVKLFETLADAKEYMASLK